VLEAFLLDFEGDLYGEAARVSFVERLREERRFERVSDLVAAMVDDVGRARAVLAETRPDSLRHFPC
jgi:riboflavin kinase/FMN adenylyltransferase